MNELNRTVLRYMSSNPFPKLVPTIQPTAATAAVNTARPGVAGAQAPAPAVTCSLSYMFAHLVFSAHFCRLYISMI